MKMSSSCQCIWCGDSNKPLAEGKKYCTECSRSCKQECKTCHKPYPNLKYFHAGADRCKSCSTRHEKRKMYTKNEAIALAKIAKGKNKIMNDERGEESDEFPPLSKLKQQHRKCQRLIIGDESDPDCCSSSCSPLTISDNESVDEIEVSGDEVQTKTDEDSEPEGGVLKKNHSVEPSTSSKPRSVYDILKDVDKKKEGQVKKKNTGSTQQKKRTYKNKPVVIKTQAQAEKDLMKSLLVYKKSSPYSTHINVIFMPSSQMTVNDES